MKVNKELQDKIGSYFLELKHRNNTKDENRVMEFITKYDKFLLDDGYLEKKIDKERNKDFLIPTIKLLFLKFEDMKSLIEDFINRFSIDSIDTIRNSDEFKNFSKKFVFYYGKIRDNFGFELQKINEIYICPYCEKNYINLIETDKDSTDIKPDLDHYYPKAMYPFLACSIENLIPSCQVCNSRLKGEKDFYKIEHINPLKHRIFDKIRFDYNEAGIFIKNNLSLNQNEINYLNTFRIKEIYSTHIEIKDDIKTKFDKYNNIKRKHLINCCPTLSENEILEIIFYEYKEENEKHPLRKLKKDLFEKIKNENI